MVNEKNHQGPTIQMEGTAGVWLADKGPNGQRENQPGLTNPPWEEAGRCVNSELHLAADAQILHMLP